MSSEILVPLMKMWPPDWHPKLLQLETPLVRAQVPKNIEDLTQYQT